MAVSLSARNGGRIHLFPASRSALFSSLPESNRSPCRPRTSPRCCHLHLWTSDAVGSPRGAGEPRGFQRRQHSFAATRPARENAILKPGQRITIDPSGAGSNNKSQQRKNKKKPSTAPRPFIDRIHLRARGGGGGAGCLSYHRLGSFKRKACGGHGGKGGNVYLVTDPTLSSLKMEKHHFSGQDGARGGNNGRNGRNGRDVHVRVPCGVVVRRVLDYQEAMDDELFADSDGEEEEDAELEALSLEGNDENDEDRESETDQHLKVDPHELDDGDDYTDIQDADDETVDDDEEDFDAYYERIQSSKKQRRRNQRRSDGIPSDYEDVVDTGVRSEDGMYYWSVPETNNMDNEQLASTAYPDYHYHLSNPLRKTVFVADLDRSDTSLLVAEGGKAGVGNQAYANRPHTAGIATHMSKKAVPGEGECTYLELELKLIADVGLVGFPNAGKSSLLSAMSRARPKIASYPFTTLHPLVGSIQYTDGYSIVMADVPGLIDGAAEGRGRGIEFLRHIERTKALVYMVDAAGEDGRDPVDDLRILGKELREYGSSGIFKEDEMAGGGDEDGEHEEELRRRRREIMDRPSLILANKMDLFPEEDVWMGRREELLFRLRLAAEEVGIAVCEEGSILGISAGVTGEGLRVLSKRLRQVVKEVEQR